MGFNLGNTNIGSLYVGSTKIGSAYLGSTKVYESGSGPVPSDEVQIGNQIWKTKNLAIDDGQGGIYTQTANYGQGNVVEYYYNWDAASRVASSISGWHLPSKAEWQTLITTVGGSNAGNTLKSTYGWTVGDAVNGTDDYGFAAFPAGFTDDNGINFKSLGYVANFWTSTWFRSNKYNYAQLAYSGSASCTGSRANTYCYSVRLIKDAT